jgi:hypothetical protein
MNTGDPAAHGNLLFAAAKTHLAPLGMKRKGKSRVWFKDNGWWLSLVEFQPSAWSKGSYLNIACMWLWHAKDYYSFDECARIGGFVEYEDPESFARAANSLAEEAALRVSQNSIQFSTPNQVSLYLDAKANGSTNPWHHYHALMASLATRHLPKAKRHCDGLVSIDGPQPWLRELKQKAKHALATAADTGTPQDTVAQEIASARAMLKLPALEAHAVWQIAAEA